MVKIESHPKKLTKPATRYTKDHLWVRMTQHENAQHLYDRKYPIKAEVGITRQWIKKHGSVKLNEGVHLLNDKGNIYLHAPGEWPKNRFSRSPLFELESKKYGNQAIITYPLGKEHGIATYTPFKSTELVRFYFEQYIQEEKNPETRMAMEEWGAI